MEPRIWNKPCIWNTFAAEVLLYTGTQDCLHTYISGSFRRHIAQKYLWSNCLSAWSPTHNKELLCAGVTFAILLSSKGESSKEPHHKKCSQYIAPKIWKLKFWGDKNPIFYAETILSKCINLTSFLGKLVKISWRSS